MSQITQLRWRGFALVAVLTSAAFARADTIYTDRSAWEAAVGGLYSEENFSDSTLNTGVSVVSDAGSVSAGAWRDRLTTLAQTTFSFSNPINAFGGNWDLTPGGAGLGIQLYYDGVPVSQQISNTYSGGFFGFKTPTPFNSVKLTIGTQGGVAETYVLDNMVYASPVPLPAAAWMGLTLLGGVGGAGYIRRRRSAGV